jgi:hypothetical protein
LHIRPKFGKSNLQVREKIQAHGIPKQYYSILFKLGYNRLGIRAHRNFLSFDSQNVRGFANLVRFVGIV